MTTSTGTIFGAFSEDYDRYRPDYPDALWSQIGLTSGQRVVDLGAGTGRAALALSKLGCKVTAVEPDPEMAHIIRTQSAREHAKIGVVEATAEKTGLGAESQDAVIAAQAYHWFTVPDANREALRLLKPGGLFAVFWNDRQVEGNPWLEAFEKLIQHYNPAHSRDYRSFDVVARIQEGVRFASVESHTLPHSFTVDVDRFIGLARTFSYVRAAVTPTDLARFEGELREILVAAHGNSEFEVPFETNLTVARKAAP